jgi:MFS family permease
MEGLTMAEGSNDFGFFGNIKKTPGLTLEILVSTWGIWVLNAFEMGLMFALGATLIEFFGLSSVEWLTILGALTWMRAIFAIPWAAVSDQVGSGYKRRNLWTFLVIFYSAISLLAVIPFIAVNLLYFLLTRFAVQVFSESGETIGVATISEWFPEETRGFGVGVHHTGFPLGFLVGGWVGSWFLSTFGTDQWYLAFSVTLLSIPFILWYFVRATKANHEQVYEEIRERGLTVPHGEETTHQGTNWSEQLSVFKNRNVAVVTIYVGVAYAVWSIWSGIFPAYINNIVGGLSMAQVAGLAVIWTITGAFFQGFWPTVSDRVGRKRLLTIGAFWVAAVFMYNPFIGSVAGIIAMQLLYGVFSNAVYPLSFAMIADEAPDHAVATGISIAGGALWVAGGTVLIVLSPIIDMFGGWTDPTGYNILFVIMIAAMILLGIFTGVFGQETVKRGEVLVDDDAEAEPGAIADD